MKFYDKIKRNGTAAIVLFIFFVIFGFILTIHMSEVSHGIPVMIGPVSLIVGTSIDTATNVLVLLIVFLVMYTFLLRKV